MPWYTPITEGLKRRAGRYLINRYVGRYLAPGKIYPNQFFVDEDISLRGVEFDSEAINELLEDTGLPIEFVNGEIDELTVSVPWTNPMQENCLFVIKGAEITLQVIQREHPTQISTSIFHSMCESFSSINMAEDCLKQTEETEEVQQGRTTKSELEDGIAVVAQIIDSIIMRIKATFKDTVFRIEYIPTVQNRGFAIEIKVGKIMYAGEIGSQSSSKVKEGITKSNFKKLFFEDVTIYSDDFTVPTSTSESYNDDKVDLPLQLAAFTGKQELIIKFKDTTELSLPRKIDEVDLNLDGLVFHMYPHQLHCLIEIMSAITAATSEKTLPSETDASREESKFSKNLENILQQSLVAKPVGIEKELNWLQESMSSSSEFQSMTGSSLLHVKPGAPSLDSSSSVPVPKISVKLSSVTGALMEQDENIAKMGGELDKSSALVKMRSEARNFFNACSISDAKELAEIEKVLGKACRKSHIALAGLPIQITYEEGESIRKTNSDCIMRLQITVGELSVKEVLFNDPETNQPTSSHQVIKFQRSKDFSRLGNPDLSITYAEMLEKKKGNLDHCKLSVRLNPCLIDFEPGLVDRTFLLFNYSDLDPDCLVTPLKPSENKYAFLDVKFDCPNLKLAFQVPKADIRHPRDIPDFAANFWRRKVHPEMFILRLQNLSLTVSLQTGNKKEPVHVRASSDDIQVGFQESVEDEEMSLIQIRSSQKDASLKKASSIAISIVLDETDRLRGKYSSESRSRSLSESNNILLGSYYVEEDGNVTGTNDSKSNIFLHQIPFIEEALQRGKTWHNLFISLCFDEVSLLLPSKHVYEVIYNRLGNDLLLWEPQIFKIKEYLYNQPLSNPLEDPDIGFSTDFSGYTPKFQWGDPESKAKKEGAYISFPKNESTSLQIHTDTCVALSVNRVHVAVATREQAHENLVLMAIAESLELISVVGLEKDPEIVLFNLSVSKGAVKFGTFNCTLPTLHFNPNPKESKLETLVQTTRYEDRAWKNCPTNTKLIKLVSKILFNSKANLKTIDLAFTLNKASVIFYSLPNPPEWIDWLKNFFTVVEYPVQGYIPPAILTEMQFDIRYCSVDFVFKHHPALISLCLGKCKVACNLLDTGKDVKIKINLEDLGLFLSKDSAESIRSAICISDITYLDLDVDLKESDRVVPFLDVGVSCHLLRARLCADTIQIIDDIAKNMIDNNTGNGVVNGDQANKEMSACLKKQPILKSSEMKSVIPDLADAMKELILDEEKEREREKERKRQLKQRQERAGMQVFHFPNEAQKLVSLHEIIEDDGNFPLSFDMQDTYDFSSDDQDDFCILDEEAGSGVTYKPGHTVSKAMTNTELLMSAYNHWEVPSTSIDYLKPLRDLPQFQSRISLKRLSILVQIFGGSDFSFNEKLPIDIKSQLGIHTEHTSAPIRQQNDDLKTKGGPGRNWDQLVEVSLGKVQFLHEVFPPDSRTTSRQVLIIPSFEIIDKHRFSEINKLLCRYSSKNRPKQTSANMLALRSVQMKPNDEDDIYEASINVSMQPIRLNIDQDTLFFLVDFFRTLLSKDNLSQRPAVSQGPTVVYKKSTETIEGQGLKSPEDVFANSQAFSPHTDRNQLFQTPMEKGGRAARNSSQCYIRSFTFSPAVPIRIDYSAKYVDLSQGNVAGLLAGLTNLNSSEVTLEAVRYEKGILGFEKLLDLLVNKWILDIRKNQVPRILGGVGPLFSVLNLFQGIKDLILMPLEQYQKDGRFIKGIQRGANSFTSSTAVSVLDLANKILGVVKFSAELAFDIMSPESSVVQGRLSHPSIPRRQIRHLSRPADIREGVFNALTVVREGFDETTRALRDAACTEHARRGLGGAVGGFLREVPASLMRPVIVVTEATSNVLEGVQGQVAPDVRKEEEEKWRNLNGK